MRRLAYLAALVGAVLAIWIGAAIFFDSDETATSASVVTPAKGDRIGEVKSAIRWNPLAKDDRLVVDSFADPKVQNAVCYVSRAVAGGMAAHVGLSEDPSRMSIACRGVGPVKIVGKFDPGGELVFSDSANFLFKTIRVTRMLDEKRNVLVYLIWSSHLIDGSPMNVVSAIPIDAPL